MSRRGPTITVQTKYQAVMEYRHGAPIRDILSRHSISRSSLHGILNHYQVERRPVGAPLRKARNE